MTDPQAGGQLTEPVRVRFAPPPSGHLRIGDVRTALYAWAFLTIAVLGAGPYSLDALLFRRKSPAEAAPSTPAPAAKEAEPAAV